MKKIFWEEIKNESLFEIEGGLSKYLYELDKLFDIVQNFLKNNL